MTDPHVAPTGPLDGVRILDLTSVVMGPYATQMLGDLGADVITIEDRHGDTNRSMGPGPARGLSGVALNLMRNKRSVALDLKDPRGRQIALQLAERSDVVVTNLRTGPLERLGLADADLRAVRPDLIVCQANGFASDSERAAEPAYDDIIQSASGLGDLFTRIGAEPALVPTLVADKVAGQAITSAVLAALYHRERTGEGQFVEIPMLDVLRAFVLVEHGSRAIPEPPLGPPGYQRILTPERRPHRTADGWIGVLPYTGSHYRTLFREGGRDDLLDDPRLTSRRSRIAHSETLYREVGEIVRGRTTRAWLDFCADHGIPAAEVASLEELVEALPVAAHPHAGEYRTVPPPVRFARTPAAVRRPAPLPGEHGRDVLAELGYPPEEIDALADADVLFPPPSEVPQEAPEEAR